MKRIRKLDGPTPGLEDYLAADGRRTSWRRFRSHPSGQDAGQAYQQLAEELTNLQHGLCGYCETDVTATDRQVEHVVPRGAGARGARLELDVGNLMVCCKGGTARSGDADRYLRPVNRNRSCGEAKGGRMNGEFVDPRNLPALPALVRVLEEDGSIEADAEACRSVGVPAEYVTRTIEVLNLNARRLCVAREKRWRALNDAWEQEFGDPDRMTEAARDELLPANGRLRKFFTTSRSYFGPIAEQVLDEQPRVWV